MNRKTNNNILVPTDFSEIANHALKHAIEIAKAYNNEITLLTVIDESFFASIFSGNQNELMKAGAEQKVNALAAEFANTGVKINTRVAFGKIYKTIAEIANSENFDSVIMGSSGASGLEQVIGSNASRTIQYAEVPVVVIKENSKISGYKKIVLPIDLSIETRQKTLWAIHIAKKFDSEIHVVYTDSNDQFTHAKINANVANVSHELKNAGVKFETKQMEDKAFENLASETLTYAKYAEADLILVMTHTESSLSEMIIGTLTQQLVNRSENIPVMCIHPAETGFTYDY